MDTLVEHTFIKEEQIDYENTPDSEEWNDDPETITVKVDPASTHSRKESGENERNEFTIFQSQLLKNFNPNQFYIAKLSQQLNSKLKKVLSPQDVDALSTAVGPNYCGVSEENRIGGDALQCSWCPAHATNVEELRLHEKVCTLSPSNTELPNQADEDGVVRPFACDICDRRFARKYDLKRHYISHSGALVYRCVVCRQEFPSVKAMRDHQASHIKEMPYICRKCNRGFPTRDSLSEHARQHVKDAPFSCRVCFKRFMLAENLSFHMKAHKGITIYPCDECEKSFESAEARTSHKDQHSVLMPYKCGFCNLAFSTFRQRQRHSDLHETDMPKKCSMCDKRFSQESNYRRHMKEAHSEKSTGCEECDLLAKTVTCEDIEELDCEDCDLPFLHQECLDNHLKAHQKEKAPCVKCGKEFAMVSAYHRHMLTHTGEQPYSCTECKLRFPTRMDLKQHMRRHWRDRPFACKICGEKFSFNNMMAHLFFHAPIKREDTDLRRLVQKLSSDIQVKGEKLSTTGSEGRDGENRRKAEEKSGPETIPRDVEVSRKNGGKTGETSGPKAISRDVVVGRKNGGRRKKVGGEENGGKIETEKKCRKVTGKNRGKRKRDDGKKRVLNESGNIQRDTEESGKSDAGVSEISEERRRSQRSKALHSYFEAHSDDPEEF